MDTTANKFLNEDIGSCLQKMDERITSLEFKVNLIFENKVNNEIDAINRISSEKESSNDALEYKIGEYIFAKVGVLLFIIGVIFLLAFPYKEVSPLLPSVLGFIIAAALYFTSKLFNKVLPHINVHLVSGAIIIFCFSVLRLHFFSPGIALNSIWPELFLLAIVFLSSLAIAVKRNSAYLSGLSLLIGYITLLVSDNDALIMGGIALLSVLGVYLSLKNNWFKLLIASVLMSYFSYLDWLIGNPVLTGSSHFRNVDPFYSSILLLYMLIHTSAFYLGTNKEPAEGLRYSSSTLNVLLSFGLFTLTISPTGYFASLSLVAAAVFITLSAILYLRLNHKHLTFIYAMTGYLALSLSIISYLQFPAAFIPLCWQSLLVVSMAIWFRSRFIVVANFIIYLLLTISFLIFDQRIELTSISFGVVSLLSARLMNWQKERLELKTEMMRNSYLLIALLIIPYALYSNIPAGFVGLSWIAVALIYYYLGKVLNSRKYRWMSLTTFAATILYVFLQGISSSEATYKMMSFLVLGAALVGVSMTYSYLKSKAQLRR
ncbi:MAG: hypothetical protein ACM3UR_11795 [Bacteroidota bacterium]|jgi:hypothetical protein|nr:DUF2339 domain-containing protein [Ignavibacteria bacterium]MCU7524673.1 DUF2339 domain-containing protein [Ignavibacteria bacterium]HEX2960559.1 hypothetical protein [Ignavibacteriales bacterium]